MDTKFFFIKSKFAGKISILDNFGRFPPIWITKYYCVGSEEPRVYFLFASFVSWGAKIKNNICVCEKVSARENG